MIIYLKEKQCDIFTKYILSLKKPFFFGLTLGGLKTLRMRYKLMQQQTI